MADYRGGVAAPVGFPPGGAGARSRGTDLLLRTPGRHSASEADGPGPFRLDLQVGDPAGRHGDLFALAVGEPYEAGPLLQRRVHLLDKLLGFLLEFEDELLRTLDDADANLDHSFLLASLWLRLWFRSGFDRGKVPAGFLQRPLAGCAPGLHAGGLRVAT